MDDTRMNQGRYRLGVLVLAIAGLWIAAWATGVHSRFTAESIRGLLAGKGLWGVVAFTVLFSAGQLLRVPGPVFVVAAVAIYGRNFGMFIALLGALVSANVTFAVVRTFAGEAHTDIQRPFVRRLLARIDSHPVMTVALLRLIFQTAPPLNYALPMTAVRWRDHLVGSVLGLPVPTAVMVCLFSRLLRE
jgi:uncharacterized membrane protein YdjX (TVP38/TMEM64 family)